MRILRYLYLAIACLVLSIVVTNSKRVIRGTAIQGKKVQYVFKQKIAQAGKYLVDLQLLDFNEAALLTEGANLRGISILIFKNQKLTFWSDNDVPFTYMDYDSVKSGEVVKLANSYYYVVIDSVENYRLAALIQLANNYPYENKFLVNGLHPDFTKSKAFITLNRDNEKAFSIFDEKNQYVFSVIFEEAGEETKQLIEIFASLFLFLGIIYLLIYFRHFFQLKLEDKKKWHIFIYLSGLILIRWLVLIFGVLNDKFYFFEPFIYATRLAPTYGDLLLNTIFLLFITYLFYHFVKIPSRFLDNSYNQNAWIGIINVALIFVLWLIQHIALSIITDSSLSIVIHNISEISIEIVIAYLIFMGLFFAYFMVVFWLFKNLSGIKVYKLIINFVTLLLVFYLLSFPLKISIDIYTVVFSICLYILVALMKGKLSGRTIFSSLVILLFVFSVYILAFTFHFSNNKERLVNRSFAQNLASEHDPVAEYLLEDISVNIKKDSKIVELLELDNFEGIELANYISRTYFKGYFKKYNLLVTPCGPKDSISLDISENQWRHCYQYFNSYIKEFGFEVPGTLFYYMENVTGVIRYFGWIPYKTQQKKEVSLFVELDSKLTLTTQPLGYPELLLDKRLNRKRYFDRFSYAKYYKNELITHNGEFGYSLRSDVFNSNSEDDFYTIEHNNYRHLVYHPDEDYVIVLSEELIHSIDMVVIFSYIFVFYYLLALSTIFVVVSRYRQLNFRDSLRNKIQFSVILILMASLLLIAGSTTWFNVRKYNQTQFRIIKEKIQSVYVELEHKLSFEDELSSNWSSDKYESIDQLLIKFSNVFYSDINLYSPDGNLLATSRPEVFQLGLQNRRMEPLAYSKMHNEKLAKFVHREHINKLSYLSAYVPFVNNNGELLAYLNLPYFTKQQELQEDITTLTVAIINIYVLLILLTIIIAVVISNQITRPLEMIQARFRDLTLGGRYEQIDYERGDEIGKLVTEYNKMVKELEKSVDLLAKSERESAWREMAKQVAHEIKNPLTPMRLSVQQLQRAWNDKKENFETYLTRVTQTLIEQIDNLSTIASEFSNFAKMPSVQITQVNITDILSKATKLFKGNERVEIKTDITKEKLIVKADPEQLNRIFINIIKNGIQSIPDTRHGQITITLKTKKEFAIIEFEDNGKGIPEDIRNKLFMPNFTTKSSGMGLGLAIVQNALEQIGGTISFKTEIGIGSVFRISLPLSNN